MVKLTVIFSIMVFIVAVCGGPLSSQPLPPQLAGSFIRIVGGQNANIADYPYQVSIMIDSQHACGGSILTTTFILSAAHCFVDESRPSHVSIRTASTQRTSGGRIIQVKKINTHGSFNADTFDYDCAVVELASALSFGVGTQPIQLPPSSTKIVNGQNSIATGWGLTTNDGNLADILQVVTLPLITTSTCQSNYYGSAVSSRMICAGTAGKDTCTGDSGGPLVVNGLQVGIVSWGDICGQASTPGVYTKVTQMLTFINRFINTK